MCDIKLKDLICRGCLSSDRKLSPLTNYDLYCSFLKDDQKLQVLTTQYVAMCWECTAILQRMLKFQAQVRRAHDILQDFTISPTEHTLSPLTVHLKHEYDATFEEMERGAPLAKIPVITVQVYSRTTDDKVIKNNSKYREEKDIVNNSLCYDVKSDQKRNDESDNLTNEHERIDILSDNSDNESFEADDMTVTTTRKSARQMAKKRLINQVGSIDILSDNSDFENFEDQDRIVTSNEMTNRRSMRKAAIKCSRLILKPKEKKSKARKVAKQEIKTQFVCVPIKPLPFPNESIQTQVSKTNSKSSIIIEEKQVTKQVLKREKQLPLIKTPVLLKLEEELKKLMCSKNTAQQNVESSAKNKDSKNNDDIESSDYELSDIEFSDIQEDEVDINNSSSKSADRIAQQNFDNRNINSETKNSELKCIQKAAESTKDEQSDKNCNVNDDGNGNKDDKNEDQDDSETNTEDYESSDSNDETKKSRKKRRYKTRDIDPEFIPESDEDIEEINVDRQKEKVESTNHKRTPRNYNKVIVNYDNIADVLEYFTEIEMSEEEIKTTLEKEDDIVYEKKPHKCMTCGECFKQKRTLDAHAKWGHGKKNLSKFQDASPLPARPCLWRCNMCRVMLRRAHLVAHVNQHHRQRYRCNGQGCEWSPREFTSRDDFQQHWADIHRRFQCDVCGRRMIHKSAVMWHIQEKHVQTPCVVCSVCGATFPRRASLSQHTRLRHPPPAPAELRYCVECDLTCSSVARYRNHLSSKHKPRHKRFPCGVCGRVLASRHNLNMHAAVHGGRTRHQCGVCGKYLTKGQALRHHMSTHSDTPFKLPKTKPCTVCGNKFQTNKQLRYHMYTHTGERPYKCRHCDAAFTQPYCLTVHLAKRHGDTHTKVKTRITAESIEIEVPGKQNVQALSMKEESQ